MLRHSPTPIIQHERWEPNYSLCLMLSGSDAVRCWTLQHLRPYRCCFTCSQNISLECLPEDCCCRKWPPLWFAHGSPTDSSSSHTHDDPGHAMWGRSPHASVQQPSALSKCFPALTKVAQPKHLFNLSGQIAQKMSRPCKGAAHVCSTQL